LAPDLPLQPIRGQASWAEGVEVDAAAFGGYAIPTRSGVLFGATHDRDDDAVEVRARDNTRNLALLAKGRPDLAARRAGAPLHARASIRAATPDKLPLAGRIGEGLYVLSGLGSRGFCTAPLLAEHIAAEALGAPSPLASDLARLIQPGRFVARAARRARQSATSL
jgi:tRNA 5-methylaminomethyl-2-thiouridine biosynthesis bifunctional protein